MKNQRGTSTLEFIVVLPCLLIVMFGIIELSRAWFTLNMVTTAAREGARAGSVAAPGDFPNPPTAIARVNAIAGGFGPTTSVNCSASPCVPDSQITATVSVTFQTVVPILLPVLQTIPITHTSRSRYE